jgi:DNA-directed RNA polymerase subunit RPC12/RpoP
MVCRLALIKEDDVVWCPYCGNPAHRKHLLEWVQLGHRCPVCRNFLEERTLLR